MPALQETIADADCVVQIRLGFEETGLLGLHPRDFGICIGCMFLRVVKTTLDMVLTWYQRVFFRFGGKEKFTSLDVELDKAETLPALSLYLFHL